MASNGQPDWHAPHWMHLDGSMVCGFFFSPSIASIGQFFLHLPQPLHFSGSMARCAFGPLQIGQWWSTTWARYSLRNALSVLETGLHAA